MSTTPERFMAALDNYIESVIYEKTGALPGPLGRGTVQSRQVLRQTLVNELRLLLQGPVR